MKKLYVVDVQNTVYVLAENEKEAGDEAVKGIHEFGDEPVICASVATHPPVGSDWMGAIPYGSDGDQTVGDIMARKA